MALVARIERFTQKLRPGEHPYCLRLALEDFERGYLCNILALNDWNIAETAQMLGISPDALRAKIDYYQVRSPIEQHCVRRSAT